MSEKRAWEVWSRDPYYRDSDSYVTAYKDKREAQAHMRTLKASRPDVTYFLKHRKAPVRMTRGAGGKLRHARRVESGAKSPGDSRSKPKSRRRKRAAVRMGITR